MLLASPRYPSVITGEVIHQVCPNCREPLAVATALRTAADKWNISTAERRAAWLANLAEESGQFNRVAENLNYSAKGLAQTWPHRYARNSDVRPRVPNALALQIERNPEKIANTTYANRMGNGGPESGDGWKYRGRGWAQLTGKDNYLEAAAALGLPLVHYPELVCEKDVSATVAGWFWTQKGMNKFADAGDFKEVCRRWNGDATGEDQPRRESYFVQFLAALRPRMH